MMTGGKKASPLPAKTQTDIFSIFGIGACTGGREPLKRPFENTRRDAGIAPLKPAMRSAVAAAASRPCLE